MEVYVQSYRIQYYLTLQGLSGLEVTYCDRLLLLPMFVSLRSGEEIQSGTTEILCTVPQRL